MKSDIIFNHQTIRLKARIRDVDGDLIDPQSIEFEIRRPDEEDYSVYTIITNPTIIKTGIGIYQIDIEIDKPGRYDYSWFTYGNPHSSIKSFFQVEDARYL